MGIVYTSILPLQLYLWGIATLELGSFYVSYILCRLFIKTLGNSVVAHSL